MTKQNLAIALLAAAFLAGCAPEHEANAGQNAGVETRDQRSSAGLPEGHADAGEKLAAAKNAKTGQSCVDCHGAEGNAPIDGSYPKLGGQYADYVAVALQAYRDGKREHALMSSQAANLTDQQISDLAAYFGSRKTQLRDLDGVHD